MPDLTIDRARNGWVVTQPPEGDPDVYTDTVEVIEEMERDAVAGEALLWYIIDALGLQGSRYDAKRLFVGTMPGDKHHDLHPQLCSKCLCRCDPDQSTGPLESPDMGGAELAGPS